MTQAYPLSWPTGWPLLGDGQLRYAQECRAAWMTLSTAACGMVDTMEVLYG